jgi:hypothetical protein
MSSKRKPILKKLWQQQWEAKWLMEFNPDKCEVIIVTNKTSHINYLYSIHGIDVQYVKYLGFTFSNNLSWNKHIDNITKKEMQPVPF